MTVTTAPNPFEQLDGRVRTTREAYELIAKTAREQGLADGTYWDAERGCPCAVGALLTQEQLDFIVDAGYGESCLEDLAYLLGEDELEDATGLAIEDLIHLQSINDYAISETRRVLDVLHLCNENLDAIKENKP